MERFIGKSKMEGLAVIITVNLPEDDSDTFKANLIYSKIGSRLVEFEIDAVVTIEEDAIRLKLAMDNPDDTYLGGEVGKDIRHFLADAAGDMKDFILIGGTVQ